MLMKISVKLRKIRSIEIQSKLNLKINIHQRVAIEIRANENKIKKFEHTFNFQCSQSRLTL